MIRNILALILLVLAGGVGAQCTPDPLYTDSVYGVWPDTTTNFAPANLGQNYTQQLDLIVPTNAGELGLPALPLDSVHFEGITGLPPGLTYACNSQTPANCTYLPSLLGCGIITGVPLQTGTFELTLDVIGYGFFLGNVVSEEHSFTGYRIIVTDGLSVGGPIAPGLGEVRNVPNPFTARTAFEFELGKAAEVDVRVFNLLGDELWKTRINGKGGVNKVNFDGGHLPEGVYLYKIETNKETFTGRMILHR